jgi:hypothetical protein
MNRKKEQLMNISKVSRIFLVLFSILTNQAVCAHGGAGLSDDTCRGMAGAYSVHFTAYQPQYQAGAEYCWDIPRTGETIVAFDLVQKELRAIPTEIRIVKDTKSAAQDSTVSAVAAKPSALYPRGTVALDANLSEPGRYMAVVTFKSTVPTIVKIPIRVDMKNGPWLITSVGLALACVGATWLVRRRQVPTIRV